MTYKEFLETKQIRQPGCGFDISAEYMNSHMFAWQKDVVRWALRKGKSALFEECGLGKTIQQLEFAKQVHLHCNKPVLILAPLAVADQTRREGAKFGYDVKVCRSQKDIRNGINITNYEMIEHYDPDTFCGVVLDESSILKHHSSKTREFLTNVFVNTPYKLCCTATPAPNDFSELGNHAEFLGIMSRTEMLATFFIHDGGDTSKWRLKRHAESKFFEWVASWACCMTSPADLGYSAESYRLPLLNIIEHTVSSPAIEDDNGQERIFAGVSATLSERRTARKNSLRGRIKLAAKLANEYDGQCLIWCDYNDESELAAKLIDGAVEVRGTDTPEHKKSSMIGFSEGKVRVLVSKPSIAGWGMNWQNCNMVIFAGLSDSFESYYQAIRRCWRFGQSNPVDVHLIVSDAEGAVKSNIEQKQAAARRMTGELVGFTKSILSADIKSTVRITDSYKAVKKIFIPSWIGG